jgi:hypothetical protein
MSKDFKQSYDQRKWESAAARHARAIENIQRVQQYASSSVREKLTELWQGLKDSAEQEYPQLRN